MRAPRVRKARHIVRWFLKAAGRYAVCLPPRGIYVLQGRAGEPMLCWQMCMAACMSVTQAQIDAVYATADITQQEPFTAFERLGLQMMQETI